MLLCLKILSARRMEILISEKKKGDGKRESKPQESQETFKFLLLTEFNFMVGQGLRVKTKSIHMDCNIKKKYINQKIVPTSSKSQSNGHNHLVIIPGKNSLWGSWAPRSGVLHSAGEEQHSGRYLPLYQSGRLV